MTFWKQAYDAHAPAVLAFVSRRLGRSATRAEAEDVLHETFVRAMQGERDAIQNPRAYLFRAAQNLVLNRLRRPRLVVSEGDADQALGEAAGGGSSPESATAWSAFGRELRRVLDAMSDSHRRAFEMAVLEERSYDEIGRASGWTLAQVKVNVYRARKKVVEELSGHLPGLQTP